MAKKENSVDYNKNFFTKTLSVKDDGAKVKVNSTSFSDASGNTIKSTKRNIVVVNEAGKEKYSSLRKADELVANEKAFRLNNMSKPGKALHHAKNRINNVGKAGVNATKGVVKRKITSSIDRGVNAPLNEVRNQLPQDPQLMDVGKTSATVGKELQYRFNRKAGSAIRNHFAKNKLKRNTAKVTVDDNGNVLKIEEKKRLHTKTTEFSAKDHVSVDVEKNVELTKRNQKKHTKYAGKESKKLQKKKLKRAMIERNKKSSNPLVGGFYKAKDKIGSVASGIKNALSSVFKMIGTMVGSVTSALTFFFTTVLPMGILLITVCFIPACIGGLFAGPGTTAGSTFLSEDADIIEVENAYRTKENNINSWAQDQWDSYRSNNGWVDNEEYLWVLDEIEIPAVGHNPYALASYFSAISIDDDPPQYNLNAVSERILEQLFNEEYSIGEPIFIKDTKEKVDCVPNEIIDENGVTTVDGCTPVYQITHHYKIKITNSDLTTILANKLSGDKYEHFLTLNQNYGGKDYLFGDVFNMPLQTNESGQYINADGSLIVPSVDYGNHGFSGSGANVSSEEWQVMIDYGKTIGLNKDGTWTNPEQCTVFTAYNVHQMYPDAKIPTVNGVDWARQLVALNPGMFVLSDEPAPGAVFSAGPGRSPMGCDAGHVGIINSYDAGSGILSFSDGNTSLTSIGGTSLPLTGGNTHINVPISRYDFESFYTGWFHKVYYAVPIK